MLSTLIIACSVAVLTSTAAAAPTAAPAAPTAAPKGPAAPAAPWETCVKDTGGTCNVKGCNEVRGGDKKVECDADSKCMCKEGFCALGGVCYDTLPGKDTGGTCKYLGCNSDRDAKCVDDKCLCEGDTFATTTSCAHEDDMMGCAKSQNLVGVCRAKCQKDTVLTCMTSTWWCGDNSKCARDASAPWMAHGLVSAGFKCSCMEGFCATDTGMCVKTAATPKATEGFKQPFPTGLCIQAGVWFLLIILCCKFTCCKKRSVEPEDYTQMKQ